MKNHRGLKIFLAIAGVIALGSVAFWCDCCAAAESWQSRFEAAMTKDGKVRLADLVDFDWDAVYLLESYDLDQPMSERIFGSANAGGYWWDGMQRYWTIIYHRPSHEPLIIRMSISDWYLTRTSRRGTREKSVSLRVIAPGDPKWPDCPKDPSLGKCVAVEE
jgi:hypothetical protein